jgi:hypothetical protein
MNVTHNCLEATRLLSKSQHEKLNISEKLLMSLHLSICNSCKAFQTDMDYLKQKLAKLDKGNDFILNEEYKEKLHQMVLKEINK